VIEDVFFVVALLYYAILIYREQKYLTNISFEINHPILRVHLFALVQLTLWTINGIVKGLDANGWYIGQHMNFFWQFLNLLNIGGGYLICFMFLYLFLPFI
jgi:hypothetical protein